MSLRRVSLRTELFAIFGLMAITLMLAFGILFSRFVAGQTIAGVKSELADEAGISGNNIVDHFAHERSGLQITAERLGDAGTGSPTASTILAQTRARFTSFKWLGIVGYDGRVMASVHGGGSGVSVEGYSQAGGLKEVLASNPTRMKTIDIPGSSKRVLALRSGVQPASGEGSRPWAVIGFLDTGELAHEVAINREEGTQVGLINNQGVVALGPVPRSLRGLAARAFSAEDSEREAEGLPGETEDVVAAVAPIRGTAWALVLWRSKAALMAQGARTARGVIGITFLVVIAAATAGWYLASRVSRELKDVGRYAQEMSEPEGREVELMKGSSREIDELQQLLKRARIRVTEATENLFLQRRRAETLAKENEVLYSIEKQVSAGAARVSGLANKMAASLDLTELMVIALAELAMALDCSRGVLVVNLDGGSRIVTQGLDIEEERAKTMAARLWSTPEICQATTNHRVGRLGTSQKEVLGDHDISGGLVVPLYHREGCNGFAILLPDEGTELVGPDIGLAKSLAKFAAVAIENVNLFMITKKASAEASLVLESSMWITESISSTEIIGRLMEASMKLTNRPAALLILRRLGKQVKVYANYAPEGREDRRRSQDLGKIAYAFEKTALLSHPSEVQLQQLLFEPEDRGIAEFLAAEGMRHATAVPLALRGITAGSFWLLGGGPIDQDELGTVVTLANIAVTALENAHSYERKHRISEILQRSLLPMHPPAIEGTELGVFYASATEEAYVGGDFYDVTKLPDGTSALLLGDVCGKGVAAARTSGMVKEVCSYLLLEHTDPAGILSEANKAVYARTGRGAFVTALLARMDVNTGRVWYANAGHPPGILVRRAGGIELLATGDIVLGALGQYEYRTAECRMNPGDKLVLYSDGVTEARSGKELFGEERLAATCEQFSRMAGAELLDVLKETVSRFAGGKLSDDVAILVCELLESEQGLKAA